MPEFGTCAKKAARRAHCFQNKCAATDNDPPLTGLSGSRLHSGKPAAGFFEFGHSKFGVPSEGESVGRGGLARTEIERCFLV